MYISRLLRFSQTLKSYSLAEIILTIILSAVFVYAFVNILFPSYSVFSKGVYIESAVGKIVSLNPLFADLNDIDRDITKLVFSGLVKYYPDTQEFKAELAEYEISEDGTLYTFKIKDNIKWHDSEDFTAQDVYYTYRDVIQSEDFQNSILKSVFSRVEIEKKDDKTVVFKLPSPNTYFISELTVGILPYHILKNVPVKNIINADFNKNPVGTGSFEFKSYKASGDAGKVVLKRFDDYYGKKPEIHTVEFFVFPNSDSLVQNLTKVNAIPKVTSDFADNIRANASIKMISYGLPHYTALFFNTNNEILKKKEIRTALAKAIDPVELAGLLTDREAVNAGFFETSIKDKLYKPDKDKAVKILDGEDYKLRGQGDKYRKNKKGEELGVVLIMVKYPLKSRMEAEMQKVADYISQKWTEIGINAAVEFLPQDEFNSALKNGDYGAVVAGESFSYNMDLFSFWYSTQAASSKSTAGGLNFSNYTNYSVDKLIEDMRSVLSKDKRRQRILQIFNYFRDDMPAVFLYRPVYYYATDAKFHTGSMANFIFSADRFWNISWWKQGDGGNFP